MIVAVLTEIIRNTLNTMLDSRVQIEHQHFCIVPWRHSDVTTIYCFSVNDKDQSSVQCCYISLCTQPSSQLVNSSLIGMLSILVSIYTVMFTFTVNYRLLHAPEL